MWLGIGAISYLRGDCLIGRVAGRDCLIMGSDCLIMGGDCLIGRVLDVQYRLSDEQGGIRAVMYNQSLNSLRFLRGIV